MTQVELRQTPTAVAKATPGFAQRALNIQAEAAARALGSIELKLFATQPNAKDVETPKAA